MSRSCSYWGTSSDHGKTPCGTGPRDWVPKPPAPDLDDVVVRDRVAQRLADERVVERGALCVEQADVVEERRLLEHGELGVVPERVDVLGRQAEREVHVAALEHLLPNHRLGSDRDDDRLVVVHVVPAAPVVLVGRQHDLFARGVGVDRVRAGAAIDTVLEVGLVLGGRLERRRADDPGAVQRARDEVHRRGVAQRHLDGELVDRGDRVEGEPDEGCTGAFLGSLDRRDHGIGRHRLAIVEGDAVTQVEGPCQSVLGCLPRLGEDRGELLGRVGRVDPQEGLVDVRHVERFGRERRDRVPGGDRRGRRDLQQVGARCLGRRRRGINAAVGGAGARCRALGLAATCRQDECRPREQRAEARGAMQWHRVWDLLRWVDRWLARSVDAMRHSCPIPTERDLHASKV